MSTTSKQKSNQLSEKPKLSASKIKTLDDCTWKYYCNYILKLPQLSNSGAKRGTVSHVVFEVLIKPSHRKHFDNISKNGLASCKSMKKLVDKNAKKLGIYNDEDLSLIHSMVDIGLKNDFYCEGHEELHAEKEFFLECDSFIVNGFIDKQAKYKNKQVRIFDYKTSKKVFSEEELNNNLQNYMYSLACYKTEGVIPKVTFLFLRFPKKAIQHAPQCTENQLIGFEAYLSYIAEIIKNFDEKKAKTKMAFHNKEKYWLCGRNKYPGETKENGELVWGCECKFKFSYYVLKNKDGKIIASAFEKDELTETDENKIFPMEYAGCPAFNKPINF